MASTGKRDRTARLYRVECLLCQSPRGVHPTEIARLCDVSVRTTYRDLKALQGEVGLPIWEEGGRYGIDPAHHLPPIKLNLMEAVALFISARLASKYSDERDTNIEGAFTKLAAALPPPIGGHIQETVLAMAHKPERPEFGLVFCTLASAWAGRQRVAILYASPRADGAEEVIERQLDPYFIEPAAAGHARYVIGYDHRSRQVRTFKIERIREARLLEESFDLPEGWSSAEYLRGSWGIFHDDEVEVRVRFSPNVASRVKESVWHPSQQMEDQPDGSLLLVVRVAGTVEITPWLLSWGAAAEVLSPEELREKVAGIARQQAALYAVPPAAREPAALSF